MPFSKKKYSLGIIAGSFDVIHPGYINMFISAKKFCDKLLIALHDNPNKFNSKKLKPVQTINERKLILKSIKYIDLIKIYKTEDDLFKILSKKNINVRFLGDDYKNKQYTGMNLNIPIIWIKRNHHYSTTNLKKKIFKSF